MAFIIVALLMVSAFPAICANVGTENSWAAKEPLPMPSWGIVGVNGKIYAIAGSGDYANVTYVNNAVFEYDPASDAWISKKPMPTKRSSFAAVTYHNKIYLIGGDDGLNQVYDPVTDTWEDRAPMPTPRTQMEGNVVNGKIYLIGGRTGGQYSTVSVNEVYDPATDSWTTKPPIPYHVTLYASAAVDNKIYVIGGQDEFHSDINVAFNQIYDTENDSWSFGAPIPSITFSAAAGVTTGVLAPKRIYVIGGMINHETHGSDLNQVYNPEDDSWSVAASMPTARFQFHIAVVNDKLYAMGGLPYFTLSGEYCYENEQFTPIGYKPRVEVLSPENKTYDATVVSLNFAVNGYAASFSYSLDGQKNVLITDNTTLEGLSSGLHNLTVYVEDAEGNLGMSETVYFTILEPFPTTLVAIASLVIVAVVGACLLAYSRRKESNRTVKF